MVGPWLGMLVRAGRRVLHDESAAWDAVQEALIQFWRLPELPPNPRAWLLRAVVLRSLQQARSLRRRRRHEVRASARRVEVSDRDDPARGLEREETAKFVGEALSRLSPGHREILLMKEIARMDYAAIARALDIPVGTVRSRLSRARQALHDSLPNDPESSPHPVP